MKPQRSSKVVWCGAFVLMGAFVGTLASFSSGSIEKAGAKPIDAWPSTTTVAQANAAAERPATSIEPKPLVAASADPSQAVPLDTSPVQPAAPKITDRVPHEITAAASSPQAHETPIDAFASTATISQTKAASDKPVTPAEPKSFVLASTDPSQVIAPETPPAQGAIPITPDPVPDEIKAPVSALEAPDDCLLADICINQYLWALYERTPKQDTNKVHQRRKVAVKRKGKKVTVTKRFVTLVDADFTWKDPIAAQKAGMTMIDYVIGGMDRSFKRRLLYMLLAAEQAGLSPGITSAFRDDYRQSIASGQKAASDRSYHGGSLRGGYGHGLAADIVSVKGTGRAQRWVHSDRLWKWVDENGKAFGIGRPYLDRDPPHVAPIDGREYATHYRPPKVQLAKADTKGGNAQAAQDGKIRTASIQPMMSASDINARRDQ